MISEIMDFIRFRVCITIAFIGMSGYLLFNRPDLGLVPVALTPFFIFAGGYAYNNIADKEEDLINRKKVNPLVNSYKGYLIVPICFFIGILSSLFLPFRSIALTLLLVLINIGYSLFRLKKYLLIKNLYTGFGISLALLLGSFSGSFITNDVTMYYLLLSLFIFMGSIVADLRDYDGDRDTGIKTLPVYLGVEKAKRLTYLMLLLCFILIIMFPRFLILLPFTLVIFFSLHQNKTSFAHSLGGFSLIALAIWLVI